MTTLRLGFIGLDTSHVEGFSALLNDPAHADYVPGGKLIAAFPGGSPDFELSASRVGGYTKKLTELYGVALVDSPAALAAQVDAIMLTSVDGRVHLKQFGEIAALKKPVFIDKPFAVTSQDAKAIAELAQKHGTPVFSSSSLRYAGAFLTALADETNGAIIGAEFSGPLKLQPTQPGFYWYGIHTAEMLYASLGAGCRRVRVTSTADHDVVVGTWADGRIGCLRGNRAGNDTFSGTIHRQKASTWVDCAQGKRPDVGLTRAIMAFFQGGPAPIAIAETIELIRFLEAANESRDHGGREVTL